MTNSSSSPIFISHTRMQSIMNTIFTRMGIPDDERAIVVERLMEATLSGYNSHGVMRIPVYVSGIRNGIMVPGNKIEVLNETASVGHLDAHNGMGPVTATEAVSRAVAKASETGIGCISVVHSNDIARLGSYVEQPARDGYITVLMTNDAGGNPCVAPWGGVEPLMSTNPLAAGIPRGDDMPVIIDISTGVSSEGRVKMLNNQKANTPDGWLINTEGQPTNDPSAYLSSPRQAALLPLGSLIAGHKGFALSILVDILTGALSGAGCSGRFAVDSDKNGLFVLAIDPEKFVSREAFIDEVEQFTHRIKQVRKAPGVDEIYIPGERAYHERQRRMAEGVPVDRSVWDTIQEIMRELEIQDVDITQAINANQA